MKQLLFLFLIVYLQVNAQDNRKYWHEGKLSWSDFREFKSQSQASELKYFFGYESAKERFNDTTIIGIRSYCYIDKVLSWVDTEQKSDLLLRYNQVIFDIVELYKRKLQSDFYGIPSFYYSDNIFQGVYFNCASEIEKFSNQSNNGTNEYVIQSWEERISESLDLVKLQKYPSIVRRKFGYGLHCGFGAGLFTGDLGTYFTPTINFIFGFDFAFKNWTTFLNGTLAGGSKVKKEFYSDYVWEKNQNVKFAIGDLSLGYALIDNKKFKISPFAGYGFTEFSLSNENKEDESVLLHHSSWIFGVNSDYKLRKRINLTGLGEYVETSIRSRLYVVPINHVGLFSGYSINLTVGINGFGNLIRINSSKKVQKFTY